MGRLATVLSFVRTLHNSAPAGDVKVDTGGGYNVTGLHSSPVGDDAQPVVGDYAAVMEGAGSGQKIVVGYVDPVNPGVSGPGEKRIYARNPATGAPVCAVWLKSDGSVVVSNGSGSLELAASGTVTINGVTIDASGNVSVPSSLVLNGKELDAHLHLAGNPPGNTGPNI